MTPDSASAGTRGCPLCHASFCSSDEVDSRCDRLEGRPCLACTRLTWLETEIHKTKARLENLVKEHRRTLTAVNEVHDTLVAKIPQEVISLIFQHVAPDLWNLYGDGVKSTRDVMAPLDLAAVCKKWREIAFHTPHLWRSIHIYTVVPTPSGARSLDLSVTNEAKLEVFRQWASRAGSLPLSVHLEVTIHGLYSPRLENRNTIESVHILPFFDVLNDISHRLQNLAIICPGASLHYFKGNSRGMTHLHSLSVTLKRDWDRFLDDGLFEFRTMTDLPLPLVLRLNGLLRFGMTKIEWSHLTKLSSTGSRATVRYCLEVLKLCPRLTHCEFEDLRNEGSIFIPLPPFVHTSLKHLMMSSGRVAAKQILDTLILPCLEGLTLRIPNFAEVVLSLLKRSCCALKSLHTIFCDPYGEKELLNLLKLQPSIESLVIQVVNPSSSNAGSMAKLLLNLLAQDISLQGYEIKNDHEQILLPNLRYFSHMIPNAHHIPWSNIDALKSSLRPLSVIKIEMNCSRHNADMPPVDDSVIESLLNMQAILGVTLLLPWEVIGRMDLTLSNRTDYPPYHDQDLGQFGRVHFREEDATCFQCRDGPFLLSF